MTLRDRLLATAALFLLGLCAGAASAQYATLTGPLQASNGLPASNYTLSFTPSQTGYIAGTGVVVNTTTYCATSTDGSTVGLPNPLTATTVSPGFTGSLPAANYYVKYAWYDASGNLTLPAPETVRQLNATGSLTVAAPASGLPSGAVGMKVYIGTSSGAETLQGTTVGTAAFVQSVPLVAGASLPSANTTTCKQVANDVIWPVGTGYLVSMADSSGNVLPGYPMQWQIMGAGSTINLSNGLPYYHGVVEFPSPLLASPTNHAQQSIAGPLNLSGYNLNGVGSIGLGTSLPGWPIDVESGAINSSGGYLYNGLAPTNHVLLGNGTAYVDSATIPYSLLSGSPTLFYQTVNGNGTAETQRPALNFSSSFVVTDSASPAQTSVDLAPSGVTPGTYNLANVTVNAKGQVTGITSGTVNDEWFNFAGATCSQAPYNGDAACGFTGQALPVAFADTNYFLECTAQVPSGTAIPTGAAAAVGVSVTPQVATASTFNYILSFVYSGGAPTAYAPTITCHAHHP